MNSVQRERAQMILRNWSDVEAVEDAKALLQTLIDAPPAESPKPLSDERIREIWIEHGLDDEDVEGFARAIEREIISGGQAA